MEASEVLDRLRARGVALQVVGDKLRFAPVENVDSEMLVELRTRKNELMRLLTDAAGPIEAISRTGTETHSSLAGNPRERSDVDPLAPAPAPLDHRDHAPLTPETISGKAPSDGPLGPLNGMVPGNVSDDPTPEQCRAPRGSLVAVGNGPTICDRCHSSLWVAFSLGDGGGRKDCRKCGRTLCFINWESRVRK